MQRNEENLRNCIIWGKICRLVDLLHITFFMGRRTGNLNFTLGQKPSQILWWWYRLCVTSSFTSASVLGCAVMH